jgi:hypothetical protein
MNLICFPHYTCGGLLSDILNVTWSNIAPNGGIGSINHSIGKIGDSNDIFDVYDSNLLYKKIESYTLKETDWIATHCHPGLLDFSKFDQIIAVSTSTFKSKIYRWARAYHHYYDKSTSWKSVNGLDRIDKERETAKNYLKSFSPAVADNIVNIEFSEVVENTKMFKKLTGNLETKTHLDRWHTVNSFLYDPEFWYSTPVKRFHEAELEINLNTSYIYE